MSKFEQADPKNFKLLQTKFEAILKKHKNEVSDFIDNARLIRFMPHVAPYAKARGDIKQDETYIPVRLVDTNIRREQPAVVKYLTQPSRVLVLTPKNGADLPSNAQQPLEKDFTEKARYEHWETPWIKGFDGAATFGYDAVRVDFDLDYEGNFVISHVGRENLIIDPDLVGDISSQEMLGLKSPMTGFEIFEQVEAGMFDEKQAERIIAKDNKGKMPIEGDSVNNLMNISHDIYEVFFKTIEDGETIAYKFFWAEGADDFLRKPKKVFLGRRDMNKPKKDAKGVVDFEPFFEREIPVFLIRYSESENAKLSGIKGRVQLDEADQDAASALMSATVNNAINSAAVYAAPASNPTNPDEGIKPPKIISTKDHNDKFFEEPINFFSKPGPDPVLLNTFQMLMGKNAAEQSKVDVAAKNRKDSRKTATELKMTEAEASERASVQLTLFSQSFVAAYGLAFAIYRNRVLMNRIEVPENIWQLLQLTRYNLRAAGDVDVIEREALERKMLQYLPFMEGTPLQQVFLKKLFVHAFPEMTEEIEAVLAAGATQGKLVDTQNQVINQLATDETGQPRPEVNPADIEQLNQAAQQAQQMPV